MNLKYFQYKLRRRYHRLINIIIRNMYRDNNRELSNSIFLSGSPRSGTTWLANLLATYTASRIMFEPFHPELVNEFRQFNNFLYMRPNAYSSELYNFCFRVFSGDIRNQWIDRQMTQLFPKQRIIKDVRANLMLKWLDNQFPEVRKVFIIRHPCAVVLSRMNVGWDPSFDIQDFLSQIELVDDFLNSHLEIIQRSKSVEEKNAIIWCITNMVPIRQFENNELNMFLYEDLVQNPEEELSRLFKKIDIPYDQPIQKNIKQPSFTTTRESALFAGGSLTNHWKKELSKQQIDNILGIVDKFGLAWIYESSNGSLF